MPRPIIVIVGPCTSGKSTLARRLREAGCDARTPAQEHSISPELWRRKGDPDLLVYLDVSHPHAQQRRPISWGPERLDLQAERLQNARHHADLYLNTDHLSPDEVYQAVVDALGGKS